MRAARFSRFGGPEVLEVVDVPDPHPDRGEVRITVHAAGVNASDWKKRAGQMDEGLPQFLGYEAAGVVDEIGAGVTGVAIGDRVFGLCAAGMAQAELAVLSDFASIPASLDFADAAALPAAVGTAHRALDQLDVGADDTLFISGASGVVGSAAVQLALAPGRRVIGSAGPANQEYVRSLGAEPVVYGDGLIERVLSLAPGGVDRALDVAGSGVLDELITLTGDAGRVITLADFAGAERSGVRFSRGGADAPRLPMTQIAQLAASGQVSLPVARTFSLGDIADAHRVGEQGGVHGKIVVIPG